jgi:hypothetical protein
MAYFASMIKSIRLLCGDPYSFQGDERDVVFLSMVAAVEGDARNAPLTRDSFKQRFNVAVSRARDQLWLFHSVRESELSPACMRRRLINFCYNHHITSGPPRDAEYDSDFERDVAEDLGREGYGVIPGFEIAGKRIDLAVGDGQPRLAIECDGDQWHGPDQYEADMLRQRMLERCGWKFIRVRASAFYSSRPKAVRELVEAIRAHGLEPNSTTDPEAVHRDWVQEVSGAECLAELRGGDIKSPEPNNGATQRGFFDEERDDVPPEAAALERTASAETMMSQSHDDKLKGESRTAPREQRSSAPAANSIPEEARTAVLNALKRSAQPSGVTLLAVNADIKKLQLTDQRLKEILGILVSENVVSRHETPKGPRYSAER